MKRISLYPNPDRDPKLLRTRKVISALSAFEGEILMAEKYASFSALSDSPVKLAFVTEEELFTLGDLMITLGGDGTILSVSARAAKENLPIFGINFGKVGFMTALEEGEMEKLSDLLSGKVLSSHRLMLTCRVGGKEISALNEIVVASEKGSHMAELALYTDEKKLCDFRADGLIFNTPTGSTGYAFSAGGAVMGEELELIGVKAIASYLLINAHHMIFSGKTVFRVKNLSEEGASLTVCADGGEPIPLFPGEEVEIFRSEKKLTLLSIDKRSNMEVFFRKF